jgi:predicted aconitase with swiveling domain
MSGRERPIAARGIVDGSAKGPALVGAEPISFLGDVDIRTGRVVGDLPSLRNASVKGTVLIFPYTRGSAGAWRFLYQLFKHKNAPVAIITQTVPDPSVVQGAILAGIPIACEPESDLATLVQNGAAVSLNVKDGRATITLC